MTIKKVFLNILMVCLCVQFASALTLPEAVTLAVSQNKTLRTAALDVQVARERIVQSRSKLFPKIDYSYTYTKLNEAPYMELPAAFGGGELTTGLESMQASKLSLVQPLYAGGKILNGIAVTDMQLVVAQEKYARTRAEIVLEIKRIFLTALLAKKEVVIAEESIATAKEHLKTAQNKQLAGAVTRFDVLKAESQVEILKPQLIVAKSKLATAILQLNKYLELPLAKDTAIEGDLVFNDYTENINVVIQKAFDHSYELKIITAQQRIATLSQQNAFAGYLPSVSLLGTTSRFNEYSSTAQDNEKWRSSWTVVGVASLTLFDGFDRESKIAEADQVVASRALAAAQVKAEIELQVRQYFMRLQETSALQASALTNVDLAARSLVMANDQYAAGQIMSVDVVSTQLVLNQAKTALANAYFSHELVVASIQKMIGQE